MSTYAAWTAAYLDRCGGFVRGKCAEATTEMIAAFPELRRACGFVFCLWGEDQHWWCVAPDGSIVDPTVAQFAGVIPEYEEIDPANPHRPIPTGVCCNCGGQCFDGRELCSAECSDAYGRYLMSGEL